MNVTVQVYGRLALGVHEADAGATLTPAVMPLGVRVTLCCEPASIVTVTALLTLIPPRVTVIGLGVLESE